MLLFFISLILIGILICLFAPIRGRFIVKPLMRRLLKKLPSISETEKIALNSGVVGWEKYLLRGDPDWNVLRACPSPVLTQEEQVFLNHSVETLCGLLHDFEIHRAQDLPNEVWNYLKREKFFGMIIPKEYGGLGFSALAHSTVVLTIATRSVSAAVSVMVPNSLGPGQLLLHYGTETQKNFYLPRLACGLEIPCFALTELEAGSDAASLHDRGNVAFGMYQDQKVLGIRLNFHKRYITLAPIATLIGLAFKLYDPDQLIGAKKDIGITVCLLPADWPGVRIGQRHSPMGLAFMNGPIEGNDVFIPMDFVIGGVSRLGHGWEMLMECLASGRGISLPAVSGAVAQLTYRLTGAYSVIRQQFNQPIMHFEGVATVLARMAGLTYLLEAMRAFTLAQIEQHERPSLAASIAKYHMTELSRILINDAMDIHGGRGIQLGPSNYLGLGYIAMPICITVEGANILTRSLMIFGQGSIRCHPFLLDEIEALTKQDWQCLNRLLPKHIKWSARNLGRLFLFSIGLGRVLCAPGDPLQNYYRQLSRFSCALTVVADISLLLLGGQFKRRENLSAHLGDVLSYLYLASAALYYYQRHTSEEDLIHLQWTQQFCLYKIQTSFDRFLNNFPHKILSRVLRCFIPTRRRCLPNDQLNTCLVNIMTQPSIFRERLTKDCYLKSKNQLHPVELAFIQVTRMKPLYEKIKHAIRVRQIKRNLTRPEQILESYAKGVLVEEEMHSLQETERIRTKALEVDRF